MRRLQKPLAHLLLYLALLLRHIQKCQALVLSMNTIVLFRFIGILMLKIAQYHMNQHITILHIKDMMIMTITAGRELLLFRNRQSIIIVRVQAILMIACRRC